MIDVIFLFDLLQNLVTRYLFLDALPISMVSPFYQLGIAGNARNAGWVKDDRFYSLVARREVSTLELSRLYGKKIAAVTRMVKLGRRVSGLDYVDMPHGKNMPGGPYTDKLILAAQAKQAKK